MATAELCATGRREPGPGGRREPGPGGRPAPRLRLTRRGRVVLAAAAALLVTGAMAAASLAVGSGAAQAANNSISRHAAERDRTQITVRPGESLWSVAEAAEPDADTRIVIQQIIELNVLTGTVVQPGELLWVPRG